MTHWRGSVGQSPARRVALAGGLELILMPIVNLVGGVLCWFVARRVGGAFGTYPASLPFALIIAAGVATVLSAAAGLPYLVTLGSVAVSEVILLFLGNAVLVRRLPGSVG